MVIYSPKGWRHGIDYGAFSLRQRPWWEGRQGRKTAMKPYWGWGRVHNVRRTAGQWLAAYIPQTWTNASPQTHIATLWHIFILLICGHFYKDFCVLMFAYVAMFVDTPKINQTSKTGHREKLSSWPSPACPAGAGVCSPAWRHRPSWGRGPCCSSGSCRPGPAGRLPGPPPPPWSPRL